VSKEKNVDSPREQLNSLLDPSVSFAQDMLKKHGEFFPFGMALKPDNAVELVAGYTGSEHPPSSEIIELLIEGFRSKATNGKIIGLAITYMVTVRADASAPKTDAIQIALEHRENDFVNVIYPYSIDSSGQIKYGELYATPREPMVFKSN